MYLLLKLKTPGNFCYAHVPNNMKCCAVCPMHCLMCSKPAHNCNSHLEILFTDQ